MASRPLLLPHEVLSSEAVSSPSTITSEVTITQLLSMLSYDISWEGDPTFEAEVKVEISNSYSKDAAGNVLDAGNWTQLILSAPVEISGPSGNAFINISQIAGYAMRLSIEATAGDSEITALVAGKVQ